jgi:GTPase
MDHVRGRPAGSAGGRSARGTAAWRADGPGGLLRRRTRRRLYPLAPMSQDTTSPLPAAVLVGVQLPGVSDAELQASLDELGRLAKTLGLRPITRLTQHRPSTGAPSLLGEGKLKELAALTGGSGVVPSGASRRVTGSKPREDGETETDVEELPDEEPEESGEPAEPPAEKAAVVVVDHDLSPSQLRNLESATDAEVLDRSSVILSIFQRHARTREAKLQVEIARLTYLAPRLRATGAGQDRQRGGIGGKGAGESSIELDRRRIRDRIAELKDELQLVQRESGTRRARRGNSDTVALVGYTNAGKSSLMRALTGSDILIADQLFATLDTTVRVLQPETKPRLLVSDTVGFIKKLPHDLVASFRSTLEEARDAALLVHVVDASDAAWRSQFQVTRDVLKEIGADENPSLVVLNKVDRLSPEACAELAAEAPEAFLMSALRKGDVAELRERIIAFFEREMVEEEIFVGWQDQRRVHEIHETCRVLSEKHGEEGTRLVVRAPAGVIARLRG